VQATVPAVAMVPDLALVLVRAQAVGMVPGRVLVLDLEQEVGGVVHLQALVRPVNLWYATRATGLLQQVLTLFRYVRSAAPTPMIRLLARAVSCCVILRRSFMN